MSAACGRCRGRDLSANRLATLVLWRLPLVLIAGGVVWPGGRGLMWSLALEWIGLGCLTNALRCGRVHCAVMGPAFMLLGALTFGAMLGYVPLGWNVIWLAAAAAVAVGYAPELLGKRYFGEAR